MARRDAALRAMRDHDISQRRACALVGVDPKTVRRERPPDNPEIRKEMGQIAEVRRRFGYRRIGILLARKGMTMNHKKLYRLYREEGLSVRHRRGRKRARGSRSPMPEALRPNQRWSMDFVSDTFGASRRFRILAVNDDCCRENLALVADTSISGARVARELNALVRLYGKPKSIVSDRRGSAYSPGNCRPEEGHRVHQPGDPEVGQGPGRRVALHRPRQAATERLYRELQRQPARRVPQRGDLRQPGRRAPKAGSLAIRLQQRPTAFLARRQGSGRGATGA